MDNIVIGSNERSWAIDLISRINQFANTQNLRIKKAGGESTISTGTQRMFPDVVLYGDINQVEYLQGWELKMPDTLITDSEFIDDAQRKAKNLGLNSTVIWNFTSVVLYVFDGERWTVKKSWNETSHIKTRTDVAKYQNDWEELLEKVILQIDEFLTTGEIVSQRIDKVVTDSLVVNIVENNKANVGEKLKRESNVNSVVDAYIKQWWEIAKLEYLNDEIDPFIAYAKMIILNWLNKFLFAHMIKSYQLPAREVDSISDDQTVEDVIQIFNEITDECDFYTIFCKIDYNELIDDETWSEILEYNLLLKSMKVETIDQQTIQDILEQSVASSKRLMKGQYTTPEILSEILCNLTILNAEKPFMDCCCGTGTIAKAGLNFKKDKIGIEEALKTTWASDKDNFSLQLATISMSSIDTINKPVLVFNENALALEYGKEINIINPEDGEVLEYKLPKMGTICSNLPFIASERLEDEDKKFIEEIIERVGADTGITLSQRGDIYTYIPFALYDLLNIGGRMGVITSNSWLGTDSGRLFYRGLNEYFYIKQLHISGNKKWFDNADVVTVILILEKKEVGQPNIDKNTSFFIWRKQLSEFCENKAYKENLVRNSLLDVNPQPAVSSRVVYTPEEQTEILNYNVSVNSLFHDAKWLLEIKGKIGSEDKVVPIEDIFEVFRGSRRGWDALFYPEDNHLIEDEYIKKTLKNARYVNNLEIEASEDAFCCSKSKSELRDSGHHGALNWIEKFEGEVNGVGQPLPDALSGGNMYWYEMKTSEMADFFTMMNPDKRFFFGKFKTRSFINQRLIGLRLKGNRGDKLLLHALLNSIFSMYYIEAVGFGRGLGVLDINKTSVASMYLFNPKCLSEEQINNIKRRFLPILKRNILDYEDELKMGDREDFDRYILECYNLGNVYSEIKRSFLSMYEVRQNV